MLVKPRSRTLPIMVLLATISLVDVNGMTGTMIVAPDGRVTVTSYTIDDGRIVAIDVQRNPEKLRRLP